MTSATSDQCEFLISFLEKNTPLARGCLRSAENRVRSRRLWEKLTRQLNALGGAKKSVKQWQKVWADKKYLVKKAVSASRETKTDGGASTSVLTDTELRIAKIIGEGFVKPGTSMSGLALPTHPIFTEERCMKPEGDCLLSDEDGLKTGEDSLKTDEDSLETDEDSLEDDASEAVAPAPGPQRRQRVRQHQALREGSFRSRLFRMEEARLAAEQLQAQELSGIRQSLDKLVNLLEIYMKKE